jgi:hypothetical protein
VSNNVLTGFVEACFLNKGVPVAEITEAEREEEESRRRQIKSSAIYSLSSDVLLCICNSRLDIAHSFDFTEKVCVF